MSNTTLAISIFYIESMILAYQSVIIYKFLLYQLHSQ